MGMRKEILIAKKDIQKKVEELGRRISNDYQLADGESLVVLSLLKGAMPFTADLIREITLPVRLEMMVASSYGDGTQTTRKVVIKYQSFESLKDQHVLIVDDITDSGNTLQAVGEVIKSYEPKEIRYCTFLNKPARREVDIDIHYMGFDIPDEFVVGYGLDFAGNYRELPDVCVMREGE